MHTTLSSQVKQRWLDQADFKLHFQMQNLLSKFRISLLYQEKYNIVSEIYRYEFNNFSVEAQVLGIASPQQSKQTI